MCDWGVSKRSAVSGPLEGPALLSEAGEWFGGEDSAQVIKHIVKISSVDEKVI